MSLLLPTVNIGAVVGGSVVGFLVVLLLVTVTLTILFSVKARRHRIARINACIIATSGPSVTVATVSNISSAQSAPLLANEQPPLTNYNYNCAPPQVGTLY